MKICWVTNELWYSRLLLFLFNETSSHVGTIWNLNSIGLALDQNKPYGSLWSLKYWLNKYFVVHQAEVLLTPDQEVSLFLDIQEHVVMRKYDMGGYYYGMIWGLIHKCFNIPYPKVNKWANPNEGMCQEILTPILKHKIIKDTGVNADILDFSAMTPDVTMRYMEQLTDKNPLWKWKHNV